MAAGWLSLPEPRSYKKQQRSNGHKRSTKSRKAAGTCCDAAQEDLAAKSPVAVGIVLATSLYCGVKAGIQGYQHLRRRNLRHLVRHVAPVLDDLGVQYWADFGTLLGMYREKDIILHDNDADIVVLNPDWDSLLHALRARLPGYRVFFVIPSEDRNIKWIRIMAGVGIMDLYGGFTRDAAPMPKHHHQQQHDVKAQPQQNVTITKAVAVAAADPAGAGEEMLLVPQGHGDLCDIPASLVLPLNVMKFQGVPVSVPADVPGVLRYRYGETFMIPRYMDKGRDCIEQGKLYARVLAALGRAGLRV